MKTLSRARKVKGLTQEQVASYLGVHRTTYNRYEKGLRAPDLDTVSKLATLFDVSTDFLLGSKPLEQEESQNHLIPLLGTVPAGVPIEAIEDVEEYIDMYPRFVKHGELFALRVQGDSMEPDLRSSDIVIVEKQDFVDSGDIAVIRVNGEDVTVKRVKLTNKGLMLIPSNPAYDPVFFDVGQIATLPVTIIGKVIEIRRRL